VQLLNDLLVMRDGHSAVPFSDGTLSTKCDISIRGRCSKTPRSGKTRICRIFIRLRSIRGLVVCYDSPPLAIVYIAGRWILGVSRSSFASIVDFPQY